MTTYRIGIESESGEAFAYAHGDLDTMSYIGKRAVKAIEAHPDQVTVALVETTGICGDEKRPVLNITADGETAAVMLQRKLRSERKASTPAAEVPESVTV